MTSDPFKEFFSHRRWLPYFTMAALAAAAYGPTLQLGFIWDDHVILETNPGLRSWTWQNVKNDFISDNTQGTGDNYYRPFQAFSNRIDYSLWGSNPAGYHFTDVVVHIANTALVFQFLLALGFAAWPAFLTGCLFAVHPIGV